MTGASHDLWTPERRRALLGLIEHLYPLDLPPADTGDEGPGSAGTAGSAGSASLDRAWIRALGEGPYAGQDALVAALLDELDERARGRFTEAPEDVRESVLRGLEAEADPYLTHALRATLAVTLEQRLGDPSRGGNPDALGWTGLGLAAEGPWRRLR
ncbi:MAG: hypothetical protein AAGF23_08610 [Acidobacteriota bacterium]